MNIKLSILASALSLPLVAFHANAATEPITLSQNFNVDEALETGDYKKITDINELYDALLSETEGAEPNTVEQAVRDIVTRYQDQSFSFDTQDCPSVKNYRCEIDGFEQEFFSPYKVVFTHLLTLSEAGVRIFEHNIDYKLEKLLVLWGDLLRESVQFPMFVQETNTYVFLGALISDALNYPLRSLVYAQNDLGINQTNYDKVKPNNLSLRKVWVQSGVPTGAYAIPSKEVLVTNNGEKDVHLVVGRHMWNSTTPFFHSRLGYSRPSDFALQGSWSNNNDELIRRIVVPAGGKAKFNSSTGGNIWVISPNTIGAELYLDFHNVGLGTVIGPDSSAEDIEQFANAIEQNLYPYYTFITPNSNDTYHHQTYNQLFENKELSKNISDFEWFSLYYPTYGYRHGKDVEEIEGIQGFIRSKGLDMDARLLDGTQRAYYPTNTTTFTASSFNDPVGSAYNKFAPMRYSPASHTDGSMPYGHLNLHEKSHIFQDNNTQFSPWFGKSGSEATVNLIAWGLTLDYNKRHHLDNDFTKATCWHNFHYDDFVTAVKSAYLTQDPHQAMADHWERLTGTYFRGQYNIFMQIMAAADMTEGSTAEFNQIFPRTSIMHRNLGEALDDDSTWSERAHILGFSGLTREQVNQWELNDKLYVLMSNAANIDYYEILHGLGIMISNTAKEQVASYGYIMAPLRIYDVSDCSWSTPPLFTKGMSWFDPHGDASAR